ncbi:MAG: hypothetical protein IPH07_24395 [Deltaproteobacteria bacterium]|nr:hypothetical protein [Deltaproteobacteria bacterium]
MRQKFAPTHDLCARMRYVPSSDSAWRHELVDSETAELRKAAIVALGEHPSALELEAARDAPYHAETGHPFWRYFSGSTRFDLDDPALQPYLDRDAKPETWRFRRLTLDERDRAAYYDRQGKRETGLAFAYAHAVLELLNPSSAEGERLADYLAKLPRTGRSASQIDELLRLTEDYAGSIAADVGAAAFQGSQDLTRAETFR